MLPSNRKKTPKTKPISENDSHFCFYVLYNINTPINTRLITINLVLHSITCVICLSHIQNRLKSMVTFSLVFIFLGACLLRISTKCVLHFDPADPPFSFLPEANGICEFIPAHLFCAAVQQALYWWTESAEFVLKTPIDLNSTGPPKTFTLLLRYGETQPDGPRAVSTNTNQNYHLEPWACL